VEVTPEMRAAVYEQDCADQGHIPTFDNALRFDAARVGRIKGPDGKQPHIECLRCHKVWLVVEDPGDDYEAATIALDAKLLPQHRPRRALLGVELPVGETRLR
jgi:hypothetical protein